MSVTSFMVKNAVNQGKNAEVRGNGFVSLYDVRIYNARYLIIWPALRDYDIFISSHSLASFDLSNYLTCFKGLRQDQTSAFSEELWILI